MSMIGQTNIGKQAIEHVRRNGLMSDLVGSAIAIKAVQEALKNETVRNAANRYGFSTADLALIYTCMVDGLLPNPCIKSGGLMLVATLVFIEPFRIEHYLQGLHAHFDDDDLRTRRNAIISATAPDYARVMWESHTAARGEAKFSIDPLGTGLASANTGCSPILVVCALLLGIFLFYFVKGP